MPDKYISVASQSAEDNWIIQGVSANKYIDHYHIWNYDYTFPVILDKQLMSPIQKVYNAPLPVVQWFINYSMHVCLAACVTRATVRR